ncbi:MAG: hypothetical protein SPI03_04135 [Campylobacter sputorum]|uniref:hypothetical protein n=1 Tax=Campylobacter sputorum TaxID=206 RepID=UPI000B78C73F|nr:hypothetical protein [Campylobacter sputorum]ASM38837.1 hypothetical protein CSPARA_1289 [Campylobacter sputorum bv. paraureolyticus LMG 11764]MDY6120510.1 hypothetical protein [Campylobacter sputorum]
MQIIGDRLVNYEPLTYTKNPSNLNEHIIFDYDEKNIQLAINSNLKFSLIVNDSYEAIMANAVGAKFIIIKNENIVHEIQNLATYYLFDSKIAMIVNDKNDILRAIKLGIDAVIYRRAIKNGNF